jgi:hypothetical protein
MLEIVRVMPLAASGGMSGSPGLSALLHDSIVEFCPFVCFVLCEFEAVLEGWVEGARRSVTFRPDFLEQRGERVRSSCERSVTWGLGCATSVCRSEMGLGTLILPPGQMAELCERWQLVGYLTAGCHLGEG